VRAVSGLALRAGSAGWLCGLALRAGHARAWSGGGIPAGAAESAAFRLVPGLPATRGAAVPGAAVPGAAMPGAAMPGAVMRSAVVRSAGRVPWRSAAAGAMGCRFHRAGSAGRRDGCPTSHPISLMKPRIHLTGPRENGRRSAMDPRIHRTQPRGTRRRSAMDSRIHRTQPRGTGRRGAMDARIHRAERLIIEKRGPSRTVTWQQQAKPRRPGPPLAQPCRTTPDQTTATFTDSLKDRRHAGGRLDRDRRPSLVS